MFKATVQSTLFLLLAWTSSAGAILVPLSASELAQVKPILAEVNRIDQGVDKLSSSFGCPASNIPAGRIQKTVGRDPQKRVRFLTYLYPSTNLRAQRIRFFYYSRSGRLIFMQYYTSGKSFLGFDQTEVHEVYFDSPKPLIKTVRNAVFKAHLEPSEAFEPDSTLAAGRSPAQDCKILYK